MEANDSGKVLVVIPNYNGRNSIGRCLESVQNQTYPFIDTVVVDNASSDGSNQWIREQHPKVQVIRNQKNLGWGVACNIGIECSPSEFVLLLNNDAYLEIDCIEEMVRAIREDDRFGSCACKILLLNKKNTLEVCGIEIYRDGLSKARGRLKPSNLHNEIEEVFCASGCCALLRRSMLNEIGLFDPHFFMYGDDTELGWRQNLAGWRCVYNPNAIAYHSHSEAAGSYSGFKAFYVERNRILIAMKHFTFFHFLASGVYALLRYITQCYLSWFQKKGALAHYRKERSLVSAFGILLRAFGSALFHWPKMIQERMKFRKKVKYSGADISRLFKKYGVSTRDMASYE